MSEIRLNFKSSDYAKLTILPEQIPNRIPKDAEKLFLGDDKDPYYKLVAIDYPVWGTGGIYEESFFDSFFSKLNNAPIPGSKNGHAGLFEGMGSGRPKTDFIVTGGEIKPSGDGMRGTAIFKIYVPPVTENGSNETFIKENKSGMVHYSLVTCPKEREENGICHFYESESAERFDAVPLNGGAMQQKTNAKKQMIMSKSKNHADRLISQGKINKTDPWSFTGADGNKLLGENGDNWGEYALWHMVENSDADPETKARYSYPYGKNGEVYESALRAIASRAGAAGMEDLSEWASEKISSINEQNKNNGEMFMETKVEAFSALKTFKANGKLMNSEIAKELEMELRTEADKKNSEIIAKLNSIFGEDIISGVEKLTAKIAADKIAVVNARMTEEFGAEKLADGSENLLRIHANSIAKESKEDLETLVKTIKENPITKKLNADYLDHTSSVNQIITNSNKAPAAVEVVEL